MKIPFLRPVVPPHVFSLSGEGVTYANVRRDTPAGFAEVRAFAYPTGSLSGGPSGTPLLTREALSEAVTAARRLSDERLSRASVVFPDAWARILPIDFDSLPDGEEAVAEMVRWKLKKLLPGVTSELALTFREMVPAGGPSRRLLVAAAPAESLTSIERAFESLGVRVGRLAPASLALFQGLAPALAAQSSGDFAVVHRAPGSFTLLIARGAAPLFFRQRPIDADGEHEQELRLSLSYYAEKLGGPGLSAVYLHDELAGTPFAESETLPVTPVPLTGRIFEADSGFDGKIAAHPGLLSSFATVWGSAS